MTEMLKKTKRVLEKCKISAEEFASQSELRTALLDVFVALIRFWAEISSYMREKNQGLLRAILCLGAAYIIYRTFHA